jgi:FkbM family methyltransferase
VDSTAPISTSISYGADALPIKVHSHDYISAVIAHTHSFFELEILEYMRSAFPVHKTIIDAGANIGNHALYFSRYLRPERLICFEPFPPNFALLQGNLAGIAELHQTALGASAHRAGIRYNKDNLGICVVDDALGREIEVRTLDSYAIEDVSLLKIDVEGGELNLLAGAKELISKQRPVILIEGNYEPIFPLLEPCGYICCAMWKRYNTYCFVRAF